jgi:hypothetical protein
MMTIVTTLSLRARRAPLQALRRLHARRNRAPFLAAIIVVSTLFPHPVDARPAPVPEPMLTARFAAVMPAPPVEPAAPAIAGIASWYGNPRRYGEPAIAWYTRVSPWGDPVEFYAAAGPALRRFLGDNNPYHEHYPVTITNPATGITIEAVVVDWCGCSTDRKRKKLIDLAPAAFTALGVTLGRGVQEVIVQLGHGLPPLPAAPERPAPEPLDAATPTSLGGTNLPL